MSKGGKKKRSTAGVNPGCRFDIVYRWIMVDLDTDPIFKKQQLTITYLDRDA